MMNGHDDKHRANGVALNGQAEPGYGEAGDLYGDYEDKLAQELSELLHAAAPPKPGTAAVGGPRPPAAPTPSALPAPQPPGVQAGPGRDRNLAQAAPSGREAFIPAARPYNDFVDDEMPPIPSTWRSEPKRTESSHGRQALLVGAGFASGLALVVPVVLLLTGRLGSGPALPETGRMEAAPAPVTMAAPVTTAAPEPVSAPAEPQAAASALAPRTVRTETVLPEAALQAPPDAAPQPERARPLAAAEEPPPPVQSLTERQPARAAADPVAELMTAGAGLVASGDIAAAREVYGRAAATGAPAAIMALAETFDPNMLAAWGARGDIKADTGTARMLYGKALEAGIDKARARLEALN